MNAKNVKSKTILSIIAVSLATAILVGLVLADYISTQNYTEKTAFSMATVSTFKIWGKDSETVTNDIIDAVNDIEKNKLSKYSENSEIYNLNTNSSAEMSELSITWLKSVLDVAEKSNGAFDPTVGALTDAWSIGGENPRLPSESEINELVSLTDWSEVKINGNSVSIKESQKIDLGAVGKGIACDIAKTALEKSEVKKAIVAFGGSILLYGDEDFDVGIRNPLGSADDILGVLSLSDGFISTSGDYERASVIDGKSYHHIIDPKTGYPSESDLSSVTVFCNNGLLSDALSTACYVLGIEKGFELLEEYGAHGVFVDKEQNIYISENLQDKFELKDTSFKVIK